MKLSYILSVVIGISAFCILYLGLDFNIILALVISVVAYFACTMVFKEKGELQGEIDEDTLKEQRIGVSAVSNIRKIELIKDRIENIEIVKNVEEICDISNKIVRSLKENPKKAKQITKFVDYYLPFTLNILTQYNTVEDQNLTSKESKEFMEKVEKMVVKIREACENQLNNLYESDLLNTTADIKVFETMIKSDGLVDDNMNIVIDRKVGE